MSRDRLIEIVDRLETVHKEVLLSQSPDSLEEVFSFIKSFFNAKKVFAWKFKEAQTQKKKSFLCSEKAKAEEFVSLQKSFKKISFKEIYHCEKKNIYLRFPLLEGTDFYCVAITDCDVSLFVDMDTAELVSRKIKTLFQTIEKLSQVQKLNYVDDVTNLYNQRFLNVLLDQEIDRGERAKNYFSVLFIDVDHFKSVNDKNGHLIGSKILKEIAQILKISVRVIDYCFRYGGDEFLILLTKTKTQEALQVGERICQLVRETPFIVAGKQIQVTLSIGVACFPEHAKTKEKILQVADEAMYSGKSKSRNTVYVAS